MAEYVFWVALALVTYALVITDRGRPGSHSGSQSGVGLYWRYEKAIRRAESMFGSSMGFTAWQLVSHKTLRLVVPYALVAVLAASVVIPGTWFKVAALTQLVCYTLGILGLSSHRLGRVKVLGMPSAFLLLNWAAVVATWRYLSGGRLELWRGGPSFDDPDSVSRTLPSIAKGPLS